MERFAYTPQGTFGEIIVSPFRCFSIEEVWKNNQPRISCIPTGIYPIRLGTHYGKPGDQDDYEVYEVSQVPGREHIEIHIANSIKDIEGCIGPGLELGFVHGLWAVTRSREAFEAFMGIMEGMPEGLLEIVDVARRDWS